jgi:transposase
MVQYRAAFNGRLARVRVGSACATHRSVTVIARAGIASVHSRVPGHAHLLFLPAYSPELQLYEQLWPLTNMALANHRFATTGETEVAQAALRCLPSSVNLTHVPWPH